MEGRRGRTRIAEPSEGPKERKIDNDGELREMVTGGLKKGWSPEQIAGRLCLGRNRGETDMSVSHETIYTWIYAQPKGELAPDLRKFRDEQGHYLWKRDRGRCGSLLKLRTIYQ